MATSTDAPDFPPGGTGCADTVIGKEVSRLSVSEINAPAIDSAAGGFQVAVESLYGQDPSI